METSSVEMLSFYQVRVQKAQVVLLMYKLRHLGQMVAVEILTLLLAMQLRSPRVICC